MHRLEIPLFNNKSIRCYVMILFTHKMASTFYGVKESSVLYSFIIDCKSYLLRLKTEYSFTK